MSTDTPGPKGCSETLDGDYRHQWTTTDNPDLHRCGNCPAIKVSVYTDGEYIYTYVGKESVS